MTKEKDIRFCPYCSETEFEVDEGKGGSVFCNVCGIDIPIKELVKVA